MYTTYGTGFGKFSQTYHIGTRKHGRKPGATQFSLIILRLLALGGIQGILLTVIHHVAVWRDHQIAVFALHLHGLRADNHIVTRRDAALVVGVSGHCRH